MKGKPFLVRLPNPEIREAYQRYCSDHLRSLDAQSSVLIMRELRIQGYLNDLSIKKCYKRDRCSGLNFKSNYFHSAKSIKAHAGT